MINSFSIQQIFETHLKTKWHFSRFLYYYPVLVVYILLLRDPFQTLKEKYENLQLSRYKIRKWFLFLVQCVSALHL